MGSGQVSVSWVSCQVATVLTWQGVGNYLSPRMGGRFSILTEYEAGCCSNAIDSVVRLGKPVAEICERPISDEGISSLEDDLRICLQMAGHAEVKGFIRQVDEARVAYGFYAHPWALEALEFLDQRRSDIEPYHADWIQGLLFGYASDQIQRYMAARSECQDATSQHHGVVNTEETYRRDSARFALRIVHNSRCRIVGTSDLYVRS